MALTPEEQEELAALEAELGTSDKMQQADKLFGAGAIKRAEQRASSMPSAIRSGFQNMAQGVMMAPAEIASGAVRLASPETANKMEAGYSRFNDAMREGSNNLFSGFTNKNDGISKGAADTMYGIGNTLPLGLGVTGAGGAIASGAAGGLQASGEGDNRTQTLAKAGFGGALAGGLYGAVGVAGKAIGKTADVVKNRLGLDQLKDKAALRASLDKADEIHSAMKQEVNSIYKDLGIPKTKLSPTEYKAQADFINQFKHNLSTEASGKFDAALAVPASPKIKEAFDTLPKETVNKALERMSKVGDALDVRALNNPDSALYYEQLRKAIAGSKTPGNAGVGKDMVRLFGKEIPGYKEAMSDYMSSKAFNNRLGENFFNAIKSNSYDKIEPSIDAVLKTQNGKQILDSMFIQGMRKELIRNSNLTPLEQLTKTIGSDALQQSQVVNYLQKIGKPETANKIEALAGFVNATRQAQSQPNSVVGKMVGMKATELDPTKMANAITNLLNSKSKFSAELTKIMQEQVPSADRTEKLFNLLRRAGKTVSGSAPAIPGRMILDTNDSEGY
jgi:hypothetical protein